MEEIKEMLVFLLDIQKKQKIADSQKHDADQKYL